MILTIIVAIIALSVLIIVHEAGHLIVAKKSRIRAPEFSIGFGPKLFGIKKGETEYKLSLVPFGGYVKLAGMEPGEIKGEKDEFASKNFWIKFLVIVTGPFFNFLLAFVIVSLAILVFGINVLNTTRVDEVGFQKEIRPKDKIISINGKKVTSWEDVMANLYGKDSVVCNVEREGKEKSIILYSRNGDFGITPFLAPVIGEIERNHPAWEAGIRTGDSIVRINNERIETWNELVDIIHRNANNGLKIEWIRNDSLMKGFVIPEETDRMIGDTIKKVGVIGIGVKTQRRKIGILSFKEGFLQVCDMTAMTIIFIGKFISRKISPKHLGGPIAVAQFAGESARWGLSSYLNFIAFLSIQLFILNLIPFPPLDGGQALIIVIEKLVRKPISEKGKQLIQSIGFSLLILFMAYVTFNDITRVFK